MVGTWAEFGLIAPMAFGNALVRLVILIGLRTLTVVSRRSEMRKTIRSIPLDFPNARPFPHRSVPIGLTALSERTLYIVLISSLPYCC
jgi:hypothetical protein